MKMIGLKQKTSMELPWCITFTNAPSYPLSLKVLHLHFAPCLTERTKVIGGHPWFLQAPKTGKIHIDLPIFEEFREWSEYGTSSSSVSFLVASTCETKKHDKSAHVTATSGTGVAFSNRCESCIRSLARFSRVASCKAMLDERNSYLPVW